MAPAAEDAATWRAHAGTLAAGAHSVRIRTTHSWCTLLPTFVVSHDPAWQA